MVIGEKLKAFRTQKNLTQVDMEKASRLGRAYVSRVENGHVTPTLETLARFALALNVPMYQFFYDGETPPAPNAPMSPTERGSGDRSRDAKAFGRFRTLMSRMHRADLKILLCTAEAMARKNKPQRRI